MKRGYVVGPVIVIAIIIITTFLSSQANASEKYTCELYQLPSSGFAPGAAKSWHPKYATLEIENGQAYLWLSHVSHTGRGWGHEAKARPRHTSGYDFSFSRYMNQRNFARGSIIKNGELLIIGLGQKSGYQQTNAARYRCKVG